VGCARKARSQVLRIVPSHSTTECGILHNLQLRVSGHQEGTDGATRLGLTWGTMANDAALNATSWRARLTAPRKCPEAWISPAEPCAQGSDAAGSGPGRKSAGHARASTSASAPYWLHCSKEEETASARRQAGPSTLLSFPRFLRLGISTQTNPSSPRHNTDPSAPFHSSQNRTHQLGSSSGHQHTSQQQQQQQQPRAHQDDFPLRARPSHCSQLRSRHHR